ncbi:hypothetical protein [Agarilytica rhodophyticola]|uniref:hypothetical protein n=1 Tax=Agarilytica rhodophyticola TaxID=1737490 RepID=UPI00131A1A12|nr:hypothetical protein [Agarilytica rhodophyticola]
MAETGCRSPQMTTLHRPALLTVADTAPTPTVTQYYPTPAMHKPTPHDECCESDKRLKKVNETRKKYGRNP